MLTTVLLWTKGPRLFVGAVVAAVVLWAGLVLSLSQSSFADLLLGLLVIAACRFALRWTLTIAGVTLVTAIAVIVLFPAALHLNVRSTTALDRATSGRIGLVSGGVTLVRERPLTGWGSGAFSQAYRRHIRPSNVSAVSASHTIPITVAAEQGMLGLGLYCALLIAAAIVLLRGARRAPRRVGLAAAFFGIVLHTWVYAAFLEDPAVWLLLALGIVNARSQPRALISNDDTDRTLDIPTPVAAS